MERDLAIEALVQAVPYVGSSIATLYFGRKSKQQIERLKDFYHKLNNDIEDVKSSISSVSEHSEDELINLIDEIHERIETERIDNKKRYYRNLYKNSLIHPVKKDNFNERKYFADIISRLSEPHFKIISMLIDTRVKTPVSEIELNGAKDSLIKGFVQQLENYGLISLEVENIQGFPSGIQINRQAIITELGQSFHYFCLKD